MAPVALAGVTVALWTTCMTYPEAFSAFGNDTIWLILSAFFFAKVWLCIHLYPVGFCGAVCLILECFDSPWSAHAEGLAELA